MTVATAEIQAHAADPTLAAALAAGDDVAAAARLGELLTEIVPVPLNRLAAWAAGTGVRARLQDAADDPGHPQRSIVLAALDLLRGNLSGSYDTILYAGLLDELQDAGIILAADRAVLTVLSTRSRSVSPGDVAEAVRYGDGSSKL